MTEKKKQSELKIDAIDVLLYNHHKYFPRILSNIFLIIMDFPSLPMVEKYILRASHHI